MFRSLFVKCVLLGTFAMLLAGAPAKAQHAFSGNILWDNLPDNCRAGDTTPIDACDLLRNLFLYNDEANPLLGDPYNATAPDFIPSMASPALGSNDDVVVPYVNPRECDEYQQCGVPAFAQVEPVCYRGAFVPEAFDPARGGNWLEGWTYYNYDGAGRTDIDYGKPLTVVTESIIGNEYWPNTHNYLLRGEIVVEDGAELTIQEGTVIFGEKETIGVLIVARGGTLIAVGTVDAPIILTSDQEPGFMVPGDFGGIVLNGNAIANCADCLNGESCVSEGVPNIVHCGGDDCDSSGRLRYVRVEYAGNEIAPANELNAITMNSLGLNTRLEYLQAFRGSDDLFEWFGGKCTAKYLFGNGGWDDGLDWQMGFRGTVQFAVIQQWSDGASDRGIEADNNEFDFDAPCRSNPIIANVTLVNITNSGGTSTHGIRLRRGTDAQIYNSIIANWPDYGIRVTDNQSVARGVYAQPPRLNCSAPAGIGDGEAIEEFAIRTYPNPVVNRAQFSFSLPASGHTRLSIYDPAGRAVADLIDQDLAAGTHNTVWDLPSDRPAGTYFYRLVSGSEVRTGRIITVQ